MNKKEAPNLDSKGVWRVYVYAGTVGLSYCFEVLAGGLVGYFLGSELDKYFGIKGWGKVSLVIIFLAASITHVVIGLQRLQDKMDKMIEKIEKGEKT